MRKSRRSTSVFFRRFAGFQRWSTGLMGSRAFAFKCLLPIFLLWTAVGCNGTRGGVLTQLPDPALRSGTPSVQPAEPPRPMPVVPPEVVSPPPQMGGMTVVLDPGHGGEDSGTPGCSSTQYPEKVVVLAIGKEVRRHLASRGVNVIMTRTDDRFISLDERAAISNRAHADLFVSIHADASRNHSVTGATVYISKSPCRESRQGAQCVRDAFVSGGIECRGIKQADYRVLARNDRPCMLVECGFLTNPGESRKLCDPGYQARLASALAGAILEYLGM